MSTVPAATVNNLGPEAKIRRKIANFAADDVFIFWMPPAGVHE